MFERWVALSGIVLSVVACGDDDGGSSGAGAAGNAGGAASGGAGGVAAGGSASGGDASGGNASGGGGAASGGAGGESACYDPGPLEFGPGPNGEPSCLTFGGASALCGFESDDSICTFSVGCGASFDLGQCQINCEMGTTVACYEQADADCLIAAMCADDCAALVACGFIL